MEWEALFLQQPRAWTRNWNTLYKIPYATRGKQQLPLPGALRDYTPYPFNLVLHSRYNRSGDQFKAAHLFAYRLAGPVTVHPSSLFDWKKNNHLTFTACSAYRHKVGGWRVTDKSLGLSPQTGRRVLEQMEKGLSDEVAFRSLYQQCEIDFIQAQKISLLFTTRSYHVICGRWVEWRKCSMAGMEK